MIYVYTRETTITVKSMNISISLKYFHILFCNPSFSSFPASTLNFRQPLSCCLSLWINLWLKNFKIGEFYINWIIQYVSLFAWHPSLCTILLSCIHIMCVLIVCSSDCWVLVHCMDILKFVYPFTGSWIFGLFPVFCYHT